jgi:hypothetical protein
MNVRTRLEGSDPGANALLDHVAPGAEDEDKGAQRAEPLEAYAGDYAFRAVESGRLVDFDRIALRPDGSYVARVVATLVNPSVRTFGGVPCMLPEEGEWNTYRVSGRIRLRVRPTTGRARVYTVTRRGAQLELARRGEKTVLFHEQPRSGVMPVAAAVPTPTEEPAAVPVHGSLQLRSA